MGVKPALVKTLAAVDGQHYGRLPVADRKRYRDQADAVLRVMGWREKQLEEQLRETLRALRAAEGAEAERDTARATLADVRALAAYFIEHGNKRTGNERAAGRRFLDLLDRHQTQETT